MQISKKTLEEVALRVAVGHFFGSPWDLPPKSIDELEKNLESEELSAWEPFEGYPKDWLLERVKDLKEDIVRNVEEESRKEDTTEKHVEFVSYTGDWPCLCMGVLTLLIDGEECKFGNDSGTTFWESGGYCTFEGSEDYVGKGEWIIDRDDLPEKYVKYIEEIKKVFNENVPYGCCGGCL